MNDRVLAIGIALLGIGALLIGIALGMPGSQATLSLLGGLMAGVGGALLISYHDE